MPFSISGLLSPQVLQPEGRYRSLGMITVMQALRPISVSRDDNSPDMEKDMH